MAENAPRQPAVEPDAGLLSVLAGMDPAEFATALAGKFDPLSEDTRKFWEKTGLDWSGGFHDPLPDRPTGEEVLRGMLSPSEDQLANPKDVACAHALIGHLMQVWFELPPQTGESNG